MCHSILLLCRSRVATSSKRVLVLYFKVQNGYNDVSSMPAWNFGAFRDCIYVQSVAYRFFLIKSV